MLPFFKGGTPPVENWSEVPKSQKDTDARWTQKRGKNDDGCKNHVEVDVKHKMIRNYKVPDASVHDGNVFEELLDEGNTSRAVYADSVERNSYFGRSAKQHGLNARQGFQYEACSFSLSWGRKIIYHISLKSKIFMAFASPSATGPVFGGGRTVLVLLNFLLGDIFPDRAFDSFIKGDLRFPAESEGFA